MGGALLSETLTEILIPVAAVIGIGFALIQWVLVSRVKVSPDHSHTPSNNNKISGASPYSSAGNVSASAALRFILGL